VWFKIFILFNICTRICQNCPLEVLHKAFYVDHG